MTFYHILMLTIFVLSITAIFIYSFIKGNKYPARLLINTNLDKSNDSAAGANVEGTPNPTNNDDCLLRIQAICNGWFTTSKLWAGMHYALAVNSAAASIITVYIASSISDSSVNVNPDVVLYSIISLFFTMISLILRCNERSRMDRDTYKKMQSKIYHFRIGKCKIEDVVECFLECDDGINLTE